MIRSRHLLLVLALAMPACMVSGRGTMAVETGAVVVYEEPPPPRAEVQVHSRPGFVWVRGRWDWRGGQWVWVDGHWERERAGHHWQEGRWDRRGNQWVWVEGRWHTGSVTPPPTVGGAQGGVVVTEGHHGHHGHQGHHAPPPPANTGTASAQGGVTVTGGATAYPTAAPPPVQVETVSPKAGHIWIAGRWDWRGGRWEWVPGHWERERANHVWVTGRWELQGNRWVWVDGRWDVRAAPAPQGPKVRDHRR
jgi:hypothetical protein